MDGSAPFDGFAHAIDAGMSCRAAATRFGVAPSTAIRWQAQRWVTGSFAPKPQDGNMRSRPIEERREDILALCGTRARTSRSMSCACN